jgi:hypothetical protein
MQLRVVEQSRLYAAAVKLAGPVKVELEGVVQSTWNFQRCRAVLPISVKKFGSPAAG